MISSDHLELTKLSSSRFPRTVALVDDALNEGVFPGVAAGFWDLRDPDRFTGFAAGSRRLQPPSPMDVDTVFDLASLTKVMATTALAGVLVERGWLGWGTPVRAFFPELRGRADRDVRLAHLLSHTAGYPAWHPFFEKLRARFPGELIWKAPVEERQAAMRELVLAVEPEAAPGERALYSDVSFLLLGFLIEDLCGEPLDELVRKWVWREMRLSGCSFRRVTQPVSSAQDPAVAATEDCPWRGGVLQGQVHDDNTWAMGGYAGHAGAFGRLRDVLNFARGCFKGFFPLEIRAAMWTRVPFPKGCERTLGWDTLSAKNSSAGTLFGPRTVGHLGYTGTSLWIDPDAGLAVALLSNRVHPTRENERIKAFRPAFHDALRQDLQR